MVTLGNAVTTTVLLALNVAGGAQVYVIAPLAVNTTLSPEQILGAGGITVILGVGFTVTTTIAVVTQAPFVPVTV